MVSKGCVKNIVAVVLALSCAGAALSRLTSPGIRHLFATQTPASYSHQALSPPPEYELPWGNLGDQSQELLTYKSCTSESGMIKLVVRGDLAYCAMVNGLWIMDVSDRLRPVLISKLYLPEGRATDIVVRDSYAFMTMEGGPVFYSIDVRDAYKPFVAGVVQTPGFSTAVALQDSLALVGYWRGAARGGLLCVDVSDPARMGVLDTLPLSYSPWQIDIHDTLAYLAAESLYCVNISDPRELAVIGAPYTGSEYRVLSTEVRGHLAYTMEMEAAFPVYQSRLSILDLSDPTHPAAVGSRYFEGQATSITLADTLAYVANREYGLQILNIKNPQAPESVGTFVGASYVGYTQVVGNLAYVPDYGLLESWYGEYPLLPADTNLRPGDLQILDISNPAQPRQAAYYPLRRCLTKVVGASQPGFVVAASANWFQNELLVLEENAGSLRVVASLPVEGYIANLTVHDDLVLLATSKGLETVSIQDPFNPEYLFNYQFPHMQDVLVIEDTLALAAAADWGVLIFKINDPPGAPRYVNRFVTRNIAFSIAALGRIVFVADWSAGLQVYDLSDLYAPQRITDAELPEGDAFGVKIWDGRVFVNFGQSFAVFSIDSLDPDYLTSPTVYGSPVSLYDMTIFNHYGIFSAGYDGILVVDATNPDSLRQVALVNTPGFALQTWTDSSGAFLVADRWSLLLFDSHIPGVRPKPTLPESFSLLQNFPNPFNTSTAIEFVLRNESHVRMDVLNILGQRVKTLVDGYLHSGTTVCSWDGTDASGSGVASGVYFYRLQVGGESQTRKMVLVR